jgi:hypothetical protein
VWTEAILGRVRILIPDHRRGWDIRNLLIDRPEIKKVHAVRNMSLHYQYAGGYVMSGRDRPSTGEEVLLKLNSRFPVAKKLYGITKLGIFGTLARGEDEEDGRPGWSRRGSLQSNPPK